MRGTIEFVSDGYINEVGEELGWLAVAYKTGKHKHFMPWYRNSAAGTAHVVGVRCTRINDMTWQLDEEEGQHWFERTITLADAKPIKTQELKPRPEGVTRAHSDFDDYFDVADDVEPVGEETTVVAKTGKASKDK